MARPIQFRPLAPSKGLTIANGVASGLNNAMNNYARIQMQRSQMQAHMMQAQAMNTYRQAQAEQMRQRNVGGSLQDMQLINAAVKGGHLDPSVAKSLSKDRAQALLDNARPEEKAQLAAKFENDYNQGQIPSEVTGSVPLNANMLKFAQGATAADSRLESTKQQGTNWVNRVNAQNAGRMDLQQYKTENAPAGNKMSQLDAINYKALHEQENALHKSYVDADKPNAMGIAPSADEVANKRKFLSDQINQVGGQKSTIEGKYTPTQAQPAAGDQLGGLMNQLNTPKMSVTDPNIKSAKPGTIILGNDGNPVGTVSDQMHSDGSYAVNPAQSAQPAPTTPAAGQ